ncbi:unnamed protein product [Paramecium sonneborni]|uniref:Uncharacterized protein n=1 Tax=Paramecium sonneborni TaxID=65129 RepID=A0A8S1KAE1_9CILI|nr:unnamed protein product [Paramecium sonneborni]
MAQSRIRYSIILIQKQINNWIYLEMPPKMILQKHIMDLQEILS